MLLLIYFNYSHAQLFERTFFSISSHGRTFPLSFFCYSIYKMCMHNRHTPLYGTHIFVFLYVTYSIFSVTHLSIKIDHPSHLSDNSYFFPLWKMEPTECLPSGMYVRADYQYDMAHQSLLVDCTQCLKKDRSLDAICQIMHDRCDGFS